MAEFLLKRLKSKKCLQLDLCVSHTYITCLLQALPYHTAVKLVSNHSSSEWVLYYLNQFLYLQLSRLLETNSFQTLCRWMSSLLWGSHHVHYKSVSLPNCKILSSYTKMYNRMSSLLCESLQEYFHQRGTLGNLIWNWRLILEISHSIESCTPRFPFLELESSIFPGDVFVMNLSKMSIALGCLLYESSNVTSSNLVLHSMLSEYFSHK